MFAQTTVFFIVKIHLCKDILYWHCKEAEWNMGKENSYNFHIWLNNQVIDDMYLFHLFTEQKYMYMESGMQWIKETEA